MEQSIGHGITGTGDSEQLPLRWRKSRRSNPYGNCVELAELQTDEIAVRDSRHPDGPMLIYTRAKFAVFLDGARNGEFDTIRGW